MTWKTTSLTDDIIEQKYRIYDKDDYGFEFCRNRSGGGGGKEYSCEFLATSDFNLHIEREKNSCYLTQAVDCGEERLFLTMIKGVNVNPENWREVTASEKEALEKDMGLERRANES